MVTLAQRAELYGLTGFHFSQEQTVNIDFDSR